MHSRTTYRNHSPRPRRRRVPLIFKFAVLLLVVGVAWKFGLARVFASSTPEIHSGVAGQCLDDFHGQLASGNPIDIYSCNHSDAQAFSVASGRISLAGNWCLSAAASGSSVSLEKCSSNAGQVWLADKSGYYNPNRDLCLAAGNDSSVELASCDSLTYAREIWTFNADDAKKLDQCGGSEGQEVACYAEKDFAAWQSGNTSHESLLNIWTGGTPDEQWCADFVSYVYRQAGYPLTQAWQGWDENQADQLRYYPEFIKHSASSGYVPRPGDIAYFDYSGGHVEIVIAGGKTPTFIYGDSAQIDPTTGNGQMKANTITRDGEAGQVIYYLSPNSF